MPFWDLPGGDLQVFVCDGWGNKLNIGLMVLDFCFPAQIVNPIRYSTDFGFARQIP
jgi:hypothetical protein